MSDIIVGSVGVRLVPDGKGFPEKVKALTQGLTANVRLDADTAPAKAKLDEAAHDRTARIEANADTAAASAKLDAAAHERKVKFLPDVSGFSTLTTGLLALGPALVPITAAAAGLTAALGAPIAAAAGGGTLYALIAGKAVQDTEKQSKAIDQLKQKVDAAKQSVAKAATPAGKKSALATLATDTKAYNDALDELNPAQARFLQAQGTLRSAFTNLERTAGPAIFGPLTSGMTALAGLLPKVAPVLDSVSKAVGGLFDELGRSAKSGALNDFLNFLSVASGPTITTAGHVLGNIAVGFGAIAKAFAPLGTKLGDAVLHWSEGFAKVGRSQGMKDFVGYVSKEGPHVARVLGDVGTAVGHLAKALAPIGHVSLDVIDGLAKGLSKIPTPVLTAAAGALASIALSMKAIKLASSGAGLLGKIGGGSSLGSRLGGIVGSKAAPVPVFVTNLGAGGLGGAGLGGAAGAGGAVGAAAGEAGAAGALGSALGSIGLIGGAAIGGFGLASSMAINARNKGVSDAAFYEDVVAHGAEKAAEATKRWKEQQAALGQLLLGPALPTHLRNLRALPDDVRTKIETPGAVTSIAQIATLAKRYNLTPKQVRTLISLAGAGKVQSDAIAIGRLYNLTPKQVRTLISQAGMNDSQSAIRRLANLYHVTPKQVRTIITAQAGSALATISRIRAEIASIPRSVRTYAYVTRVNTANVQAGGGRDGDPSTPYASGGYTGNFDRRRPVGVVHGGEFVFDATATARAGVSNLAALQKTLRGYATGGWVGPNPWTSASWNIPKTPPPSLGNWFQQIMSHIWKTATAPFVRESSTLAGSIKHLNDEIKAGNRQIKELSKARKGESKEQKASREREVKALERHEKALGKQLEALKSIRSAFHGFNLDSVLPTPTPKNPITAGTRAALNDLQSQIRKAGGHWSGAMQDQAHGLLAATHNLDRLNHKLADTGGLNDQLAAAQQNYTTLNDAMAQLGQTAAGNFNTGLFGLSDASGARTPSTTAGILSSLSGDTGNAVEFAKAFSTLAGEGLSKSVLSELATSGDLLSATNLASTASKSDIASINAAVATRDLAKGSVASLVGHAVYGDDVAAALKTQNDLQSQVKATDRQISTLTRTVQSLVDAIQNDAKTITVNMDGKEVTHAVIGHVKTITRQTGKSPLPMTR